MTDKRRMTFIWAGLFSVALLILAVAPKLCAEDAHFNLSEIRSSE